MTQYGFYFDQTRCIGCHTCAVACKDWHDIPAGDVNWMRVFEILDGKFPDLKMAYLSIACNHDVKTRILKNRLQIELDIRFIVNDQYCLSP